MAKVSTSISIDADLKREAQELFDDLGLDMSTAITIFLKQAVRKEGLPFEVHRETPTPETLSAMRETEDIRKHPEKYRKYHSLDEYLQEEKAHA